MSNRWLKTAQEFSEKFNFKIVPLYYKDPLIRNLKKLYGSEQNVNDLQSLFNRKNITGLGIALGGNYLQAFDLDGVKEFEIVKRLLEILELGSDYPFVVKTANGYHIYFYCDYSSAESEKSNNAYEVYRFKDLNKGKQLEYRKERCYLVAPTSQHLTGIVYEFINGMPECKPETVKSGNIRKAIYEFCETKAPFTKNNVADTKELKHLKRAVAVLKKSKLNYEEWISVMFSLASLGEEGREAFINISTNEHFPDDDQDFLNEKFDYALIKCDCDKISISTLFHIAKNYGLKYADADKLTKQFFEFELCALSYPIEDEKKKLIMIRDYAIVKGINSKGKLGGKKIQINYEHKMMTDKSDEINKNYELMHNYVDNFIEKTGAQPYCRIGEDFFDETIKGKFDYLTFALLAAIYAIQGKVDKYKRITKERMGYALLGYKDKNSYELVGRNEEITSDYKIQRRTNKLLMKNIISYLTVMGRYSYYSTHLTQEELRKVLERKWEEKIEKQKHTQEQQKLLNKTLSARKASFRIRKYNKTTGLSDNTGDSRNMEVN